MNLSNVITKLEAAHTIIKANQQFKFKIDWKNQGFIQRYFEHKNSKKQFLIPSDAKSLESAQKLLELRPFLNQLTENFYKNPNNPDQAERLRTSYHALCLGLLDCCISNLFFEPIVSRYGLHKDKFGPDYILDYNFDYSLDGAAKWAEHQYNDKLFKNGWSPLRTWNWHFGSYDEYRIFWNNY